MVGEVLQKVFELTRAQHGAVATWQLASAGIPPKTRHDLIVTGRLERVSSKVLVVPGMPHTAARDAAAAVLDCGPAAVLSHTSAAAWWGLSSFQLKPLHVTRPYGSSSRGSQLAKLHEVRDLPQHLITQAAGLRIGRPELVLFQLAGQVGKARLERAIDDAWAQGLVDSAAMLRCLEAMRDRGRKGTVAYREALGARGPDYVLPASGGEARFAYVLEREGQQPMRRQVNVSGEDGWIGRVDFEDEERPFLVEILSERYHASLGDREADERRFKALRATGRVVVAFWDFQLWRQGRAVAMVVGRIRNYLDAGVPVDSPLFAFTHTLHQVTADGSPIEPHLRFDPSKLRIQE